MNLDLEYLFFLMDLMGLVEIASVRNIEARVLEIQIKQVELLLLMKRAQQVNSLREREVELTQRKTALEAKIAQLQVWIDSEIAFFFPFWVLYFFSPVDSSIYGRKNMGD